MRKTKIKNDLKEAFEPNKTSTHVPVGKVKHFAFYLRKVCQLILSQKRKQKNVRILLFNNDIIRQRVMKSLSIVIFS